MKPKILTAALWSIALFSLNLAYAYHPLSPYAYCANSPIRFVDPNGKDYYQSTGGAVIWQDNDRKSITINDELFNNIGKSYSMQICDGSYVNYSQNVAVSISPQAVDAGRTVLGNTSLAGNLLSKSSPLAAGAQQGLMTDSIHQLQSDFVNHPVTQTAVNVMAFVATGGVDGAVAVSRVAGKMIAKRAAVKAIESGQYNLTRTVAGHLAKRPYIASTSIITNVMKAGGEGASDASFRGGVNYIAPGTFNGASGIYELGINPQTKTIYHFLLRK